MDDQTKNNAIQAAQVLAERPALLEYLSAYFEERFVEMSGSLKLEDREQLYQVFLEYRTVENALMVLKNLAQEASEK